MNLFTNNTINFDVVSYSFLMIYLNKILRFYRLLCRADIRKLFGHGNLMKM